MTNDECARPQVFVIRHSTFDIRHSSFALLLLHLLLHDDFLFEVHERLGDVRLEKSFADHVEFHLQLIEIFVQSDREDFLNRPVFEFRKQASAEFLRIVAESPRRDTGDAPERVVQLDRKSVV